MYEEILPVEREFFRQRRDELLKQNAGKFALIKGTKLIGIFDSPDAAYAAGIERLGNVPMLIAPIVPQEQVQSYPALQFGLVSAAVQE